METEKGHMEKRLTCRELTQGRKVLYTKGREVRDTETGQNNIIGKCGRNDSLSFLAKRMTKYMLSNKYIGIALQKGGVPGALECIEHTRVLSQIIREAKDSNGCILIAKKKEIKW